MAKNQINFSKISEQSKLYLKAFKECYILLNNENLRYRDEMKNLKLELKHILDKHEQELKNGMSLNEVITKFPREEIDRHIRKCQLKHKEITYPLNKTIKDTYIFIPQDMYKAYRKKTMESKRGDFLNAIKEFLENLGIEGCSQGQISKFAETMSDNIAVRFTQSNNVDTFMSELQFNKLFMIIFCELYIKN